jgi:hypothetical protein
VALVADADIRGTADLIRSTPKRGERTAQQAGAGADTSRCALEGCGRPEDWGALAGKCPYAFVVFSGPWARNGAHHQWPKIIAPIVNTAAPIQIQMAAFFSEMVGVDFMTD